MPRASLVYLRDLEGRGGVGWSSPGQVGGEEKQLVSGRRRERERERDVEKGGEGWRDGCKARTLRKDK